MCLLPHQGLPPSVFPPRCSTDSTWSCPTPMPSTRLRSVSTTRTQGELLPSPFFPTRPRAPEIWAPPAPGRGAPGPGQCPGSAGAEAVLLASLWSAQLSEGQACLLRPPSQTQPRPSPLRRLRALKGLTPLCPQAVWWLWWGAKAVIFLLCPLGPKPLSWSS